MSILDLFSLKGKVSIITGGERGIGLAIAKGLAEAGSDIVIAGIDEQNLETAAEEIQALGVTCMAVKTDVTDEGQVKDMVKVVCDTYGHIDVLVNNAGSGRGKAAEEMSEEDFKWVMDINLTSQFLVSKAVGNVMLGQKLSLIHILKMGKIFFDFNAYRIRMLCNINIPPLLYNIILSASLPARRCERNAILVPSGENTGYLS